MTGHANLVVRAWKKSELNWELHGWKPDTGSAYIIDDRGQPRVLEMFLPPEFNNHDHNSSPFPQSSPSEVVEIRLMPPPCRIDQAEAHALRVQAAQNTDGNGTVISTGVWNPSLWEFVRLSYDKEVLILRPEDDKPLTDLLPKFKEEKLREYNERKREIQEMSERLRRGQRSLGQERYYSHFAPGVNEVPSSGAAEANLYFLNQERIKLEINYTYRTGYLNWTLEEARQNTDLRDPYLQSKWAVEHGLDLLALAMERKQAAIWAGLEDLAETRSKPLKRLFGPQYEARQPSPATLAMSEADELKFGASIRYRVTFSDGGHPVRLTSFRLRQPEQNEVSEFGAARGKVVTVESIADGHGHVLSKLDSIDKKTDQVLTGVQALAQTIGEKEMSAEQSRENPLGSRQAVADYLLTMDSVKVVRRIAVAIVRFGYGDSRKACADAAGVSEATIKRALAVARTTPYGKFFARTRKQKLKARAGLKQPDEVYARLRKLAEEDPEKLRTLAEQMILKAQKKEPPGGSVWDQTVDGLS